MDTDLGTSSIHTYTSSVSSSSAHTCFLTLQQLIDNDRKNKQLKEEAYQALLEECEAISAALVHETVGRNLSAKKIQRHARGRIARHKASEEGRSISKDVTHQKPPAMSKKIGKGSRTRSPSPRHASDMSKEVKAATKLQKMHRGNAVRKDFNSKIVTHWLSGLYVRAFRRSEARKGTQSREPKSRELLLMTPEKVRAPKVARPAIDKNGINEDAATGVDKELQHRHERSGGEGQDELDIGATAIQGAHRRKIASKCVAEQLQLQTDANARETAATKIQGAASVTVDTTSLETAATRIQAAARRKRACNQAEKARQVKVEEDARIAAEWRLQTTQQQKDAFKEEIRLDAQAYEEAAIKIQAAQRRKRASTEMGMRRQMKKDIEIRETAATRIQTAQRGTVASKEVERNRQLKEDAEARDIAATKLQAALRRKRAMQQVEKDYQARIEARDREAAATKLQAAQRKKAASQEFEKARQLRSHAQAREAAAKKIQAAQRRQCAYKVVENHRLLKVEAREAAATKIQAVQRRKEASREVEQVRQMKVDAQAREAAAIEIQKVAKLILQETCDDGYEITEWNDLCEEHLTTLERAHENFGPLRSFGEAARVREVAVQCDIQSGQRGAQAVLCSHWYQVPAGPPCRLIREGQAQTSWTAVPALGMEADDFSSEASLDCQHFMRGCAADLDIESDDLGKTLQPQLTLDSCKGRQVVGNCIEKQLSPVFQPTSFAGNWYPVPPTSPKIKTRPQLSNAFAVAAHLYGARPFDNAALSRVGVPTSPPCQRNSAQSSMNIGDFSKPPDDVQCAPTVAKKIVTSFQVRRDFDPLWRRSNRPSDGPTVRQFATSRGFTRGEHNFDAKAQFTHTNIACDGNDEAQNLQVHVDRGAAFSDTRKLIRKSPRAFPTLASDPGRLYAGHCMRQSKLHVSQRPPWQEIGRGVAAGAGTLPKLTPRKECPLRDP